MSDSTRSVGENIRRGIENIGRKDAEKHGEYRSLGDAFVEGCERIESSILALSKSVDRLSEVIRINRVV